MTTSVEMPEVMQCETKGCAYNTDSMCHARAITVGNMRKHVCDTMLMSSRHTERRECAGVGACRSVDCMHNENFECQAEAIRIVMAGGMAQCGTYSGK